MSEVGNVRNSESFDAFVVGSALYIGHWMKEAKEFAKRNRAILSNRPVWLFSSGLWDREEKFQGPKFLDPKVSGPCRAFGAEKENEC